MTVSAVIAELWWAGGADAGDPGDATVPARRSHTARPESPDAVATDDARIVQLRAGDAAEFDAVVLDTFPLLARVAARLTGSMADGEEVAQEVLLRLWVNRETLQLRTTLTVYLLGAVRNRALNVVRDRKTAERKLAEPTLSPTSTAASDATVLEDERRILVARALDALGQRHRMAVELRYGARASFAEVGAALGVSARAAEQVVRRAVAVLRRTLDDTDL